MRIIVNADDLGINPVVNENIFAFMDKGLVTSATLIMNAPAVDNAVRRIGDYPHVSFGVHLNITEFCPLTKNAAFQLLVDDKGCFMRSPSHIPSTSKLRRAVFDEWCSQIEKAQDMGIRVSHIDSHNHIHNEPALFFVLKRIQQKFGIRKVRQTWNIYAASKAPRTTLRCAKKFWSLMLRHFYRTTTTDGFTSFATFHELIRAGQTWKGDIELMCHPGHPMFEDETRLLNTEWHKKFAPNALLINYNDL